MWMIWIFRWSRRIRNWSESIGIFVLFPVLFLITVTEMCNVQCLCASSFEFVCLLEWENHVAFELDEIKHTLVSYQFKLSVGNDNHAIQQYTEDWALYKLLDGHLDVDLNHFMSQNKMPSFNHLSLFVCLVNEWKH